LSDFGRKNYGVFSALNKISEDFWKISDRSRRDIDTWDAFLITPLSQRRKASKRLPRKHIAPPAVARPDDFTGGLKWADDSCW
jgi:hypothetical protein